MPTRKKQPEPKPIPPSPLVRYSYIWATAALFIISLTLHWTLAWQAYVDEQKAHNQPVEVRGYLTEVGRDTFENWQSEFLQLIWQVAGLMFLLCLGSPQSKEGDERLEGKVDALLELLDSDKGKKIIQQLDKQFPKG